MHQINTCKYQKGSHGMHECVVLPPFPNISLFRDCNKWLHTKQNMSTYEVVHLKCVKRLISSAVLWCVASTRTRPRSLITRTPPPSRMSVVAGRTRRSFRSLHALPPVCGGHVAVQSVSDGQKHTVVLLHCSSTPSFCSTSRRGEEPSAARMFVWQFHV